MSFKRHIIVLVFLIANVFPSFGQTEAELKENADKLFDTKDFVGATSFYLRLLSLNPRDPNYNYRYGTCLLFNSNKKQDAIRYLKFAVTDQTIDANAYFFLGKAYHLNFQFNDAIKSYESYISKAGKGTYIDDANRNIEMCRNGKKLLSTITEIVVTKKTEIIEKDFYDLYELSSIGGSIVVSADFQSKNDKKNGHTPLIHFPAGAQQIFYGSYGEDNQKDIYIVRKLPDGKWGEPQKVPGGVNTQYDEDYPYMHPDGKYLYFSSKGHNSMGGYDVFRSPYDANSNTFGPPENIDFAISSPDDDIFYVVDKEDRNAFFASSRQSQDHKLYVYKVLVDRFPIQLAVVKGDFKSTVDPSKKKVYIDVIDNLTEKSIGKFNSQADGGYLITFPKGGKYTYKVKVEGSNDEFIATLDVPFLKEFKPLKQKLLHEMEDGNEVIKIVNLFNEDVEDAQAIMAQVLKNRSDLNVNVNDFNLEELDAKRKQKEILAEIGMSELSLNEVGNILGVKSEEIEKGNSDTDKKQNAVNAKKIENYNEIKALDKQVNALVKAADSSESDVVKYNQLKEAKELISERKDLLESTTLFEEVANQENASELSDDDKQKFEEKSKQINAAIAGNDDAKALQLIKENSSLIEKVIQQDDGGVSQALKEEKKELDNQLLSLNKAEQELVTSIELVESQIKTLEVELEAAKEKNKAEIQSEIDAKKDELKYLENSRTSILAKEKEASNKRNDLVEKIEANLYLENYSGEEVTDAQVDAVKKQIDNQNNATIKKYIDGQLNELIAANPTLESQSGNLSQSGLIIAEHETEISKIQNENNLSDQEKWTKQIASNNSLKEKLQERSEELRLALQNDKFNKPLGDEKAEVDAYIKKIEIENQRLTKLLEGDLQIPLTQEQVEKEVFEEYASQSNEIANNSSLNENEKNNKLLELDKQYLNEINDAIERNNSQLSENPENQDLIQRKEILNQLKSEVQTSIESRGITTEFVTSNYTKEEAIEELNKNYSSDKEKIQNSNRSDSEKMNQLQELDQELLQSVNKELATLNQQLVEEPSNNELIQKKEVLEELAMVTDAQIQERKQVLDSQLNAMTDEQLTQLAVEKVNEISPNYESSKTAISNASIEESVKQKELIDIEKGLQKELDKAIKQSDKKVEEDPLNVELLNENRALKLAKSSSEERVEAIENSTIVEPETMLNIEEELAKIDPSYKESIAGANSIEEKIEIEEAHKEKLANKIDFLKNNSNSEDEILKSRLEEELNITNRSIEQLNVELNSSPTSFDIQEELTKVDPDYIQSIAKAETVDEKLIIEKEHLQKLEEKASALNNDSSEDTQKLKVSIEDEIQNTSAKIDALEKEQNSSNNVTSDLTQNKLREDNNISLEVLNNVPDNSQSIDKNINELKEYKNALESNLSAANTTDKEVINSEINTVEDHIVKLQNRSKELSAEQRNSFISSTRNKSLEADEEILTANYSTKEDLEKQDKLLAEYEQKLEQLIAKKSSKEAEEKEWLNEELSQVKAKRKQISVTIGELTQEVVIENNPSNSDVDQLVSKEKELKEELASGNLSTEEKRLIEEELQTVQTERVSKENPIIEASIEENSSQAQGMIDKVASSNNKGMQAAIESMQQSESKVETLMEQAKKSKNPIQSNYALKEAQSIQENAKDDLAKATVAERIETLNDKEGLAIGNSKEELEEKKRKFSIELGELTQEINSKQLEKETAKRKDQTSIQVEIDVLEKRRSYVRTELMQVEEQLKLIETKEPFIAEEVDLVELTYNEERQIAASEEYAEIAKVGQQALELEKQIANLESNIKTNNEEIRRLVEDEVKNGTNNETTIQEKIEANKRAGIEIGQLTSQLEERKTKFEELLPSDSEESMKIQNLVKRGVNPLKKAAIIAALVPLPASGITINAEGTSTYSEANPIPVNVEQPSGLVYRVQVGAFAKPIPQDLFKEFTPVSGEVIGNTNITRYMAGFFNNSEKVVDAREQIRQLGYSDAFVVAYCDGKRIPFGEARRMEQSGECVPKGSNEMMLEVAQNTAISMGLEDTTKTLKPVPEYTYNQAPGAAKADAVEQYDGLFFTVQIGVYNRPVGHDVLHYYEPLITMRLPNGQIRYSVGKFDNVESARSKRTDVRNKVSDAFVTAYYQGERIGWQKAMQLLEEQGDGILEDFKSEEKVEDTAVTQSTPVKIDVPIETVEVFEAIEAVEEEPLYIQIVTKNTFEEYPRDVLNRYNNKGSFFFDEKDRKVKSAIYDSEDRLPRVYFFKDDIDTVYMSREEVEKVDGHTLLLEFNKEQLEGDFADWLLRFNYRRAISMGENGLEMRIFGVKDENLEKVSNELAVFGYNAVIVENRGEVIED